MSNQASKGTKSNLSNDNAGDGVDYEKPRVEILGDLRDLTEGGTDDNQPDDPDFGDVGSQ